MGIQPILEKNSASLIVFLISIVFYVFTGREKTKNLSEVLMSFVSIPELTTLFKDFMETAMYL